MADLSDDDIEAIGHRKAWRYRHEKHEHESNSIYEFRRFTLIDFARAAIAADRALNAPAQAPAEPVAWLWQHSETGRTRIVMNDELVSTDATWFVVGPLMLNKS